MLFRNSFSVLEIIDFFPTSGIRPFGCFGGFSYINQMEEMNNNTNTMIKLRLLIT